MPLSPYVIDDFPGLDFRDRVGTPGAVVAHNVQWMAHGAVRRRPNAERFTAAAFGSTPRSTFRTRDGELLVTFGEQVAALNGAGVVTATSPAAFVTGSGVTSFTDYKTPASSRVILAGAGGGVPREYAAGAFATPAFTGVTPSTAAFVAATPWDNRAVYVQSNGRVYFSDPGVPYTVDTNNYVDLNSPPTGIAVWRDQVFVFATQRFWIFYGTSVDGSGGPVFEYRAVDSQGSRSAGGESVVAHPTGVYFLSGNVVMRTTGGVPDAVSRSVSPFFNYGDGVLSSPIDGGSDLPVGMPFSLGCDDRHVYVGLLFESSGGEDRGLPNVSLVVDLETGKWATTSIGGSNPYFGSAPGYTESVLGSAVFVTHASSGHVRRYSYGVDLAQGGDDGATPVAAHYRTGWLDVGAPGVEKEIRSSSASLQGALDLTWNRDFTATLPAFTSLDAGAVAASYNWGGDLYWSKWPLGLRFAQVGHRGALFQLCIKNTNGAFFELSRVVANVREVRAAGVKTT